MELDLDIVAAEPVHKQIGGFLRRQIASGKLPAGARLPTTHELAKRWNVHLTSVQRGMAPLVAQGLLERRRKHGTFVRRGTQTAPIAILFGPSLADEAAHFYRAFAEALKSEARRHQWTCRIYDGLNPLTAADQPRKDETIAHLKHDLETCGFKGQIHVALRLGVSQMMGREIALPMVLQEEDVLWDPRQGMSDCAAFLSRAGRRRLVYLRIVFQNDETPDSAETRDDAPASGIPNLEMLYWPLKGTAAEREAETERRVKELIADWRGRPEGMPDGLIVSDDIMTRGVALALLASGMRVPEEIMVMTEATNRVHLHYGVPVVRCEYSVDELAKETVGLLWKRTLREPLPALPILLRATIKEGNQQCIGQLEG
ncbi:MAG: GntR family transcriptional regulator [Kiritimatiellae bacterium]|nr:GntR family transcriptional regulator [Kiritimatiellia bacterium]